MKTAAYYARVSSDKQKEEKTIQSQEAEILERITADGNVLSPDCRFTDDGWSGTILDRPGLDQMRDAALKGKFQTLYVYDRGRLARKFVYQELVIEELQRDKIEFVTLHDHSAETPEDRVLQGMQGLFHEFERIKIAERMRRGKLYKARNGYIVNGPGPYGFTFVPKTPTEQSHFIVNEDEAKVVRMIFQWVADEDLTTYGVVKRLFELGISPRKEKRKQWSKSVVARLLACEAYVGTAYYNRREAVEPKQYDETIKYRKNKKTSRRERSKDKWISIAVPPILDQALFDRARVQLQKNYRFAGRRKMRDYLLVGMIYCECGSRMVGEFVGGHMYYRCTDRLKHQPAPKECKAGGVNCTRIDGVVWDKVRELLVNPQLLREQAERWLFSKEDKGKVQRQNRLTEMQNEKNNLLEKEKKYAELLSQKMLSFEAYTGLCEQINKERARLEKEEKNLHIDLSLVQNTQLPSIEEICEKVPRVVESLLSQERRKLLIDLLDRITVDFDRRVAQVSGYLPLSIIEPHQNLVYESISRNSRIT